MSHTPPLVPRQRSVSSPTCALSIVSAIGRQTLRTAPPETLSASALQQLADQGDELRTLLEALAEDMAAGNMSAAQARLSAVLTPVRHVDETYHRLCAAHQEARHMLQAAQAADREALVPHDAVHVRQLHATASAVAAAFDELAICAQAWAELVGDEVHP